MKLLTREETQGLDSTSKTIQKWDEFFKTALPNLGYRDSLLENMYPYSKGIPMLDGTYLPVSKITGRAFFQMSWADKLAQVLACFPTFSSECTSNLLYMEAFMARLWRDNFEYFNKFFKDATKEDHDALVAELNQVDMDRDRDLTFKKNEGTIPVFNKYWAQFIENSDIYITCIHNSSGEYSNTGKISESLKAKIQNREMWSINSMIYRHTSGTSFIIYCKLIEDVFDKLSQDEIISCVDYACRAAGNAPSRIRSFGEVYLQDYLVLSLNPIDKFMCSTKQAFSSCMSIAKQNDSSGTYSTPAFGLPAIFPSDSVFMLFLTPGKHKNMYWEEEEWVKVPSDRDKEKAYKYLKMTCRALTYKGVPQKAVQEYVEQVRVATSDYGKVSTLEKLHNAAQNVDINTERLYVGRQYSANGEDFIWQEVIEFLLAHKGISTSMAYATEVDAFSSALNKAHEDGLAHYTYVGNYASNITDVNRKIYLRRGSMHDDRVAAIDRYGYIRGIYYDNLALSFLGSVKRRQGIEGRSFVPSKEIYELEYPLEPIQDINVGTSRFGSGGITWFLPGSGLDMFKIMNGTQSYQMLNTYVIICDHCKKMIVDESESVKYNGLRVCGDCAKELELETCPCCNTAYSKTNAEEAAEHTQYNIMEFVNPKNYKYLPPKYVCKAQLELASTGDGTTTAICAHCGDVMGKYSKTYNGRRGLSVTFPSLTVRGEFKGYNVYVQLCESCLRKAVMCDKCHRLIFLDSITDACLLLPNRRVVCPDCVDSIRMQKDKRAHYTEILSALQYNPDTADDSSEKNESDLEAVVAEQANQLGLLNKNRGTLLKDVHKQIRSYLQRHPEQGAPVLKSSNIPFPGTTQETEEHHLEVVPVYEEV